MLQQVAGRVWVTTAATWLTTSTVVVDDDGTCLLVDPTLTPADLRALAREIRDHGWRVAAAFSTHPHWDHVLWSRALPDVPRWATAPAAAASTGAELAAQADIDLPGYSWDVIGGTTPLPPGATEVPWSGPRAVVVPTPGHAPGHASLHLPDDGVLVAGDLLSDVEVPLLDTRAEDPVRDYRGALGALGGIVAACDVVVPGHGTPANRRDAVRRLEADLAYLDRLGHSTDRRLADPRVRAEHDRQVRELGGGTEPHS